ncbi:hypothetical protein Tco_1382578 [Tanacetum coccineum]
MDLKWQLALLSMRARRECRNLRNQESKPRNQDSSRRTVNVEGTSSKAMVAIDGAGFDWIYMADEEVPTNLALMDFSYSGNDSEVMVLKSNNVQHKPEQANQPKKVSQNLRNNKTKWNEIKTQKLGVGFQTTKKACFVCGSFNHLIKDYDFHDKKMVQKPVLNNVKKGTGQREVRPVWNNAMKVNHQNISNSRRNFVPTAVLTKSGIVPVSAARPINTAAPKSFVNVAKTRPNAFQKSHSLSRRPFYQQTALKNRNLNDKVNTAKVNSVNTAKGNRVTSAVGEQGINAVKSSACWADTRLDLKCWLYTTQQMVINSPCLIDKKELAIPGQTTTGKEFSNPLMADSLPKTILPTKFVECLEVKFGKKWVKLIFDFRLEIVPLSLLVSGDVSLSIVRSSTKRNLIAILMNILPVFRCNLVTSGPTCSYLS